MEGEQVVRVALVGNAGVGKSALAVRLLTGRFLQHYDPTLEDEYRTLLKVKGEEREVAILDTAGQVCKIFLLLYLLNFLIYLIFNFYRKMNTFTTTCTPPMLL